MGRPNPYRTNTGIHIEWFTVRRSTIYTLFALIVIFFGAAAYGYYTLFGPRPEEPVAEASPVVDKARFLELDGTVKVRKAGTYAWADATMAMVLDRNDTIRTVGGSSARVRLFDGTEYLLQPDSILVIERAFEDPNTKVTQVRARIESGRVSLNTPRRDVPGSRSDVETPTSEATLAENTSADVTFDSASGESGFTVFRGQSVVRAGDEQVTLDSSRAVKVTADNRFSRVIELPGVPSLVTPANLDMVPVSPTMEFKWHPVNGARRYHVVLDRSPYFKDPILESNVPKPVVLHQGLEPGTYYWQVTAIDGDDRRGAPSDLAKFTVSSRPSNAAPPELTVYKPSETHGGVVTVQGKTDLGAVVTVDRGMGDDRVQVRGDGSFTYYFEVREAGRHRVVVKARKRDGGVAEKTVYAEIGTD